MLEFLLSWRMKEGEKAMFTDLWSYAHAHHNSLGRGEARQRAPDWQTEGREGERDREIEREREREHKS